jgi:diguanylate cyclase (GGDEF)-like protein
MTRVISIKKYIELDPHALLVATTGAFVSALEAISENSIRACPPAGSTLQGELLGLGAKLPRQSSPDEMVKLGQEVVRSIQAWGEGADRNIQRQAGEVKEIMLMMARTAESMVDRDQRYGTELNQLTTQLQSIATLHDLTQIRSQLISGATQLKACVTKMNSDSQQSIQELRKELTVIQTRAEDAERLATIDPLTGLPNRRRVEAEIDRHLATGQPFCVLFFDLNGFKRINDIHGHLAGDQLLKAFAAELRSAFRVSDIVGRWGGDEFVAILDGGRAAGESYLARIREWIFGEYPITLPDKEATIKVKVKVEASVGVTESRPGETAAQLLSRADAAMYKQKPGEPTPP